MLGEGPDDITGSVCTTEKKSVLTLVNQRQDFACVSIIMVIIVTCLLMGNKSKSLKLIKKNFNFPTRFCLGIISETIDAAELQKHLL